MRSLARTAPVLVGSVALHIVAFIAVGALEIPVLPTGTSTPSWVSFETIAEPVVDEQVAEPPPPEPQPEPVAARSPEPARPRVRTPEPDSQPSPVPSPPAATGIVSHEGGMPTSLPAATGAPSDRPIAATPAPAPPAPPPAPSRPSIDVRALVRGWVANVGELLARRAGDRYPRAARRAGLEGQVLLSIVVDDRGRVLDANVRRSSGHAALDEAALAMVGEVGSVPAPPRELAWEPRPLTVPVSYRLR